VGDYGEWPARPDLVDLGKGRLGILRAQIQILVDITIQH
jgi:hypothetical protein